MHRFIICLSLPTLLCVSCSTSPPAGGPSVSPDMGPDISPAAFNSLPIYTPHDSIDEVLTDFHDAAHRGDFDRYFGLFTDDAIFYGTDPDERWTIDEFKGYAREPFADGHGWTYHMRERNIFLDEDQSTAWFDEIVESEHYGKCRGSGALVLTAEGWKLTQYNLVIPVPNDFADEVVAATKQGLVTPRTIYLVRHAEKQAGSDPPLSDEGRARAARLAMMLADAGLDAIFSTDFNRTRSTAVPVADSADLDVEFYDPRDPAGLANFIRSEKDLDAALVVGHSNTVPAILTALGIEHEITLAESEYDHLFIVRIDQLGRATMTHLHF